MYIMKRQFKENGFKNDLLETLIVQLLFDYFLLCASSHQCLMLIQPLGTHVPAFFFWITLETSSPQTALILSRCRNKGTCSFSNTNENRRKICTRLEFI